MVEEMVDDEQVEHEGDELEPETTELHETVLIDLDDEVDELTHEHDEHDEMV